MPNTQAPIEVFYSYAHEDEVLRNELEKHLSVLHQQGVISSWHDRKIVAGQDWGQAIDAHLETTSLILLLISADFLASHYCYGIEMQWAMERHQRGETYVIPVILRPCSWQSTPIGSLQALPRDGQAITTWTNPDEAFLEVEQSLRVLIEQPHQIQRLSLSTSVTTKNRESMLLRLQSMYQELLNSSLQETAWIELDLDVQSEAVQNAANLLLRRATQPRRLLPPGTSILEVYQEANRELLILGAPGAGKSTLLYQLGHELLKTATEQPTEPFPVLFPLSSWAEKRLPLTNWMEQQLNSPLYQIPKKQSQQWVLDGQILPLLDGLDEMPQEARPACIAAINAYRRGHPLCPLVVCSRSAEYLTASAQERLQLQSAIEVQPLTEAQLDAILIQAGKPFAALRSELKKNEELRELALTPLWLNVLLLAFKNTSLRTFSQQRSVLQRRVFENYVQRMVEGKGRNKRYPLEQTKRWLTFLAKQMRKQNQTTFAVELLQPNWLKTRSHFFYRWSVGLIFGLLGGLAGGPVGGLTPFGLVGTLIFGLVGGLVFGLIGGLGEEITLPEKLIWSWKQARFGLVGGLIVGLIGGLFGLTIFRQVSGLIIGLVGGLIVALVVGLTPDRYIERHTLSPGEGLRRSLWSGIVYGLIGGLIGGLIVALVGGLVAGLIVGLSVGLIVGLSLGLGAVVQHFLLRIFLWQADLFPLRSMAFLEDTRARHLLQRIGGSYHFVHQLLFDYCADLETNGALDLTVDQGSPGDSRVSRPHILTVAALLLGFVSLSRFTTSSLVPSMSPPWPIEVIVDLESLIGLVAAYGLWKVRRWGIMVALVISVLNVLVVAPSLIPGFVIQSSLAALIVRWVNAGIPVFIIVLTLLPSARRACT